MSSRNKRRLFLAAWLIALATAASIPALAIVRGTVVVGPQTYRATGILSHPLFAVGARVVLPRGSRAMVVSLLGPVDVSGKARDDIATIGAPVYLHSGSETSRDVFALGSSVYRSSNVHIEGRVGADLVPWSGRGSPGGPNWVVATWRYSGLGFAVGLALLLICTCLAVAFPWHTALVATSVRQDLARSMLAGLMGAFLFVFLVVPLGLSLFGLPFAVLIGIAALAAWLLGLTGVAVVLGTYLARIRRHEAGLLWAVVSGMFVLAVVGTIPWIGFVIVAFAGATGAGSLALSVVARARLPASEDVPRVPGETNPAEELYIQRVK